MDEARSAGLPVAVHANTEEGIRRAVLAGVRTVEHGSGATDELLSLMRKRGVALVNEHHVDVTGVVQLPTAELSHTDNREGNPGRGDRQRDCQRRLRELPSDD